MTPTFQIDTTPGAVEALGSRDIAGALAYELVPRLHFLQWGADEDCDVVYALSTTINNVQLLVSHRQGTDEYVLLLLLKQDMRKARRKLVKGLRADGLSVKRIDLP